MSDFQQISATQQEPGAGRFSFQVTQLIWLFLGLLESLFALRLLLRLLGANPADPFATLLYNFTAVFLAPFVGFTQTPAAAGMVLEASTVVAMVVYALLAWVLARAIWNILYRPYAVATVTTTNFTDQRMP